MSKEKQIEIEVITYEQGRFYFFVDQVSLAQKKYDRLFKTFKDAPYASEGARFLSDAGRELQFYKDVVEMLEKGYRKQSEWISVEERLPETDEQVLVYGIRGSIRVCRYESRYDKNFRSIKTAFYRNDDKKAMNVRYWMPFPEAPKGGAE